MQEVIIFTRKIVGSWMLRMRLGLLNIESAKRVLTSIFEIALAERL
jgi:hypothetical protein